MWLLLPLTATTLLLGYYYYGSYKKYQKLLSSEPFNNSKEIKDPVDLKLESGQIPSWLNGIMYRIGPGIFNIKQNDGAVFSIRHGFDGLPFMHRFEVNGQTQALKYNSRCLAKSMEHDIQNKSYDFLVFFGYLPNVSFVQWLKQFFARFVDLVLFPKPRHQHRPDGQSVGVTATPNFPLPSNLTRENERILVSKTDANILQKVHADTLEPEHIFDYSAFDQRLGGQLSAAHHQYDPMTGEVFNFTLTIGPKPRLVVFSISKEGKTTILGDTTCRADGSPIQSPYIHSFWLTQNYIIIPESPLVYKGGGLNMLLHGSALSSMSWDSSMPTYFHVFSRTPEKTDLVASIPAPSFYTFHVANAFETKCKETGDVLLNLHSSSFANGDILHQLHTFGMPRRKGSYQPPKDTTLINGISHPPRHQTSFGDLVQYQLNLTQSSVHSIDTLAPNVEFPRFNQDYTTKPDNQYVYGCQLQPFTETTDETVGLIKVDLNNLSKSKLYSVEGFSCSEPIFVPKPKDAASEDDGVLLTFVNNFDCCYFIVLDALEMKELARVKIGQFTAVTFHGSFVDHEFKSVNLN
ncbi:putative carotene-dioxygenase [Blakeslea trispora]|nr:putative carotene-dioxygenase [Blakeslea trispora]